MREPGERACLELETVGLGLRGASTRLPRVMRGAVSCSGNEADTSHSVLDLFLFLRRYLKRGVSDTGKVANDVEVEQARPESPEGDTGML